MDLAFFLRGLLIGFSIAAPVGPIGILAIRRTLTLGRWAGLLTGLGAATADALYGCIAGFGLTAISELLIDQAFWLKLVGGIFLCYLGIKTFMSQPAEAAAADDKPAHLSKAHLSKAHLSKTHGSVAYLSMYASTVLLTLTNPATILSFAAVFVGLGLAATGSNYLTASVLVAGVFCGSALWWLLLSSGANLLRRKITPQSLRTLNRISGLILLTFGIIALSAKS